MKKEIINKVSRIPIHNIDISSFIPKKRRVVFDIKQWLKNDLILIEKEFRNKIKEFNWDIYSDKLVSIQCSNDAIIPDWAFILVSSKLKEHKVTNFIGSLESMEEYLIYNSISKHDFSAYENKTIIIQGCSNEFIPKSCYSLLIEKLQPIVKKILFGEACSSVAIFKKIRT
tara:strand:+ start:488 stop:1000 length:513 start_codon:yes stop_codon:yes gene_type:complete